MSVGEYLTNKYALWLDFRMIDENYLHGAGRKIEKSEINIQIKKKAERAGDLTAYAYLIMDAQLNIENGASDSVVY